jgi:flagellar motor component MotA
MDKATFIGLLSALGIVIGAAFHQTHGNLLAFYSTEGVLLVMCGAMFATMISMPMKNFK